MASAQAAPPEGATVPEMTSQTLVDAISLVDLLLGVAPLPSAPKLQPKEDPQILGGLPQVAGNSRHGELQQHAQTPPACGTVSKELQVLLGLCSQLPETGDEANSKSASQQQAAQTQAFKVSGTRDSGHLTSASQQQKEESSQQQSPAAQTTSPSMQAPAVAPGQLDTATQPAVPVAPLAHCTNNQQQQQQLSSTPFLSLPPTAFKGSGRSSQPNLSSSVRDMHPHLPLPTRSSVQNLPLGPGPPTPQGSLSPQARAGGMSGVMPSLGSPPPLHAAADTLDWRGNVSGLDEQGLRLWTGNRSKADVARLGVRLIQASELGGRGTAGRRVDPYVTIKCERTKHVSKAVMQTSSPQWDEFVVFEVQHPAFAVLRIKVYDHRTCWSPELVGEVRISVKSISDFPAKYCQPSWHPLRSRHGRPACGQVQVQLYYMSVRVHRPLNVLCATWNVGNAAPDADLSSWLKGVNQLTHDLVAIGVQECSYKAKDGRAGGVGDDDDPEDPDWGPLTVQASGGGRLSSLTAAAALVTGAPGERLSASSGLLRSRFSNEGSTRAGARGPSGSVPAGASGTWARLQHHILTGSSAGGGGSGQAGASRGAATAEGEAVRATTAGAPCSKLHGQRTQSLGCLEQLGEAEDVTAATHTPAGPGSLSTARRAPAASASLSCLVPKGAGGLNVRAGGQGQEAGAGAGAGHSRLRMVSQAEPQPSSATTPVSPTASRPSGTTAEESCVSPVLNEKDSHLPDSRKHSERRRSVTFNDGTFPSSPAGHAAEEGLCDNTGVKSPVRSSTVHTMGSEGAPSSAAGSVWSPFKLHQGSHRAAAAVERSSGSQQATYVATQRSTPPGGTELDAGTSASPRPSLSGCSQAGLSVVTDAAATDFALLTQEDDVEIEEEGEGGVEDAMRQLTSGRLSMNGRVGAAGAGAGGGGLGASGRGDGSQSMKQHRGWGLLKGLMGKGAGGGGQVATSSPVANRDGAGGMATGSPSGQSSQAGQQQRLKKLGLVGQVEQVGGRQFKDVWRDRLKEAMGQSYYMVKSVHMGQIRLLLFARNDIYAAIKDVTRGYQATGVGGVATNKGGVAIALQVWDTEVCFINSHLAAHQDKVRARNNNYRDIVKGIRMDSCQMDLLTSYHHVFWMGDLNYRLDYGSQAMNPTETPTPADFDTLVADIEEQKYSHLLGMDQLRKEMAGGRAFLGFHEADPAFPPTFKVERKAGIVYKPQRSPAWCDRVLYRSNLPLKQVKPLEYWTAADVASSDHKPVAATFQVPTVWRQDDPSITTRVFLVITRISCSSLFMLRKRRKSSTTNTLPNPAIVMVGPCLSIGGDGAWRTRVARQTRDPVWLEDPPALLPLKPAAIQDLAHRRLLVRVVDTQEGKVMMRGSGSSSTLARGVLPLTAAATDWLKAAGRQVEGAPKCTRVKVALEYNGLPAGTLEVDMRLEVEAPKRASIETRTPPARSLLSRLSMSPVAIARRSKSQVQGPPSAQGGSNHGGAGPGPGGTQGGGGGGSRKSSEELGRGSREGPGNSGSFARSFVGRISFAGGLARVSSALKARVSGNGS